MFGGFSVDRSTMSAGIRTSLHNINIFEVYKRWYIDLAGPPPKSDRGNVYILTCVDAFTEWAEAFLVRNKEAETVVRLLVGQVFFVASVRPCLF